MSKAVLVMDMPKCCGECRLSGTGACRKWNVKAAKGFPKDCPIRELPEKKIYNGVEGIIGFGIPERVGQAVDEAAALGWNACIDAIVGTEEQQK